MYRSSAEPKSVEELTKLRNNYIELIQLKVHQGHVAFIQNLSTYFDNHYFEYENFDLLFVRRNLLTANEVINAIKISPSCIFYPVRYEDNTIYSLNEAFPRIVNEMTHTERANILHFALGGVPTILRRNIMKLNCESESWSFQSWSVSSCAGELYPPKLNSSLEPIDY
jgi:hypothetical protein